MFRGNPARTGALPGPGPDPAFGVKVRWTAEASGDPAVVDGVVYVGSNDGRVYAIGGTGQ